MSLERAKSHILTEKSAGVWLFYITGERKMYKAKRNYENVQRMQFLGKGKYDIPEIWRTDFDQADFIGFNYAKNEKAPENKGIHFFLDDYQFNRLWPDSDRYIEMLKRFKYVLSPDFSLYTDFPIALQIYKRD